MRDESIKSKEAAWTRDQFKGINLQNLASAWIASMQ